MSELTEEIKSIIKDYKEGRVYYTEAVFRLLEQGVDVPAKLLAEQCPDIPRDWGRDVTDNKETDED